MILDINIKLSDVRSIARKMLENEIQVRYFYLHLTANKIMRRSIKLLEKIKKNIKIAMIMNSSIDMIFFIESQYKLYFFWQDALQ